MLAICLDITGAVALTIFGGIASTPVAFFESSRFIHFLTCDSVTGEKSKFDNFGIFFDFVNAGVFVIYRCIIFNPNILGYIDIKDIHLLAHLFLVTAIISSSVWIFLSNAS